MKSRKAICFALAGLFLALTVTMVVQAGGRDHDRDDQGFGQNRPKPLKLVGTILIPGSPIASTDIAWVDQNTETLVVGDRSNKGVDVVDAENDVYLGRVQSGQIQGTLVGFGGPTSMTTGITSAHQGPNGVVTTPDKKVWAGDGDSTLKVADLDPTSPTYLQIIAVISTVAPGCTGGYTGTCDRADELAYDPAHNIIVAANDEPSPTPPAIAPYLTFINASYPYNVLGHMNFAAQGEVVGTGLEQPVWDPGLHSVLQTLPANNMDGTGSIVIIDPIKEKVTRVINLDAFNCSPSGMALGPDQHVVVACKVVPAVVSATVPSTFPLVIDVETGNEIGPGIDQVGGGDEVNYSPGDNRFVVSSTVEGESGNPGVLGVINADSGDWLQNLPAATAVSPAYLKAVGGSGNLAALGENNHVFVIVKPTAKVADICPAVTVSANTPPATDYGCVAVFGPTNEDPDSSPFSF
jgi:hypothetical protein